MMKAWLYLILMVGAFANAQPKQEVLRANFAYPDHPDDKTAMNIYVDRTTNTIKFHMEEDNVFADVETLEDYESGFAVSRIPEEEGCFVRKLTKTLDESIEEFKKNAGPGNTMMYEGRLDVDAVEAEDPEIFGDRISEFCGDMTIYKFIKSSEDSEALEEEENQIEERLTITFRKCFICFFFFFKCITTTITISTGPTIIFPFFFFG